MASEDGSCALLGVSVEFVGDALCERRLGLDESTCGSRLLGGRESSELPRLHSGGLRWLVVTSVVLVGGDGLVDTTLIVCQSSDWDSTDVETSGGIEVREILPLFGSLEDSWSSGFNRANLGGLEETKVWVLGVAVVTW